MMRMMRKKRARKILINVVVNTMVTDMVLLVDMVIMVPDMALWVDSEWVASTPRPWVL